MGNQITCATEQWVYTVLDFCPFDQRGQLPCLCRAIAASTSANPYFREWLCRRLHVECRLYAPTAVPLDSTWDELFRELWQYRDLWTPGAAIGATDDAERQMVLRRKEASSIQVSVRFRPTHRARAAGQEPTGKQVVLPLHQRLQLFKDCHSQENGGAALTSDEAIGMLKQEGSWFSAAYANQESTPSHSEQKENLAPPADNTAAKTTHAHVHTVSPEANSVVMVAPGVGLREFNCFSNVMGPESEQGDVYERVGQRPVMDFLNG
jgi:hypothetical protein